MRSLLLKLTSGSSIRARLARATGWMLAGTALQQGSAMIASVATARILGPVAFGELGLVRSTTLLFAALAGGGLMLATTRYVAALRVEDPERAGRVIGLILSVAAIVSSLGALVCIAFSRVIAANAMQAPQLALPIAISAVAIVLSITGGVQVGVVVGCESFRTAATLVAMEGLAAAAMMVAGAWIHGVVGAAAGFVLGSAVSFVLKHVAMSRECARHGLAVTTRGMRAELSILGEFVLPAVLLGVATQPAEWLSRVMLARTGLAEVGLFTAAFAWAQIVIFVPSQVASPAMPMLTSLFAARDHAGFRKLLIESVAVVLAVALAVALPVALLAPWVMRIYGRGFVGGAGTLAMIVLAYAAGAVTMVFRSTLLSTGRAWLQNAQAGIWGLALIAAFSILRGRGAWGLALSYAIAFVVLCGVQAWTVRRMMRAKA